MAEVRLADIIVPVEAFAPGVVRASIRTNAYFNSGLVANSAVLGGLASANEAQKFSIPYLGRIANVEPNVSSDDPAVVSVPQKVTSEREDAVKQMKNQSWSVMDLAEALGVTPDPMGAIQSQVATYWSEVYDDHIANILTGVVANNVANDAGDMVHDISGVVAPGNIISAAAGVAAAQTMGDQKNRLGIVVMHSLVHSNLQQANLITTVDSPTGPAQSNIRFQTFLDHRIVVSDAATMQGANYVTVFGAPGAIQYGLGRPKTPTAVDRKEEAGNGEGQEILHSRNHFVFHPIGHSWTGAVATPAYADLANVASWTRVTDRKRVPLAALISAG